ncbi:MAG: potassium-transporting ATPase subunit C [Planctomycetia bacterium]|nr:potassium-transporting ATPase subunit C [Planctomycetia bacterium]
MMAHLRANLWLLVMTLLICSVAYPAALLGIGQTVFRDSANGSLIAGPDGKPIGSRLIAQPFTGDEYFQPRPSYVSYNAAATGGSNWGASNYLLRDRVARQLGPIVKYKDGRPVAQDIEAWFQKDQFQGQPGIVAQWAQAHSGLAAAWVKADPLHADYVASWIKQNPSASESKLEELAVPFFISYSKAHPGTFPVAVEQKAEKLVQSIKKGIEIQSIFFDMWRQDHPQADLQAVPADMVMASGCGLDPHITLDSALYQLDRVATSRAAQSGRPAAEVRTEIEALLREKAAAPLGGLAGVKLVNVLEVNLALAPRDGAARSSAE